jgi:hypothetical protein
MFDRLANLFFETKESRENLLFLEEEEETLSMGQISLNPSGRKTGREV